MLLELGNVLRIVLLVGVYKLKILKNQHIKPEDGDKNND